MVVAEGTASGELIRTAESVSAAPRSRPQKSFWLRQPSADFLRDPYFYLKYDLGWLTLLAGSSVLMLALGWRGVGLEWGVSVLLVALGASYVQMMANAFIHNCSHQNWPRPVNRLIGELLGMIVGTRYASWEILHRRHHMFSDDVEKDPHPMDRSYWKFFWAKMIINLERNLHQQYYELWGDTPEIRRRELVKSWVSVATGAMLFGFWYVLLGPVAFFGVYVPALLVGTLHLTHFNWATHNAMGDGEFKPVNLDSGIFWLGNRILFGVYMHANHHAYVTVFNPLKLDPTRAAKVEAKIARVRG
jgi:stearoyl-CoA desaturase (delta-9 desaturase)